MKVEWHEVDGTKFMRHNDGDWVAYLKVSLSQAEMKTIPYRGWDMLGFYQQLQTAVAQLMRRE